MRRSLWSILGAGLLLAFGASAQNIALTNTSVNVEGAIHLEWQSETGAVYRVEYSDELSDSITWRTLYDRYPSHGTNTFWLDTGNYVATPYISHPQKTSSRFYRIFKSDTDTVNPPMVSIATLTNNFTASGDLMVTVVASTEQATISAKLYVDGEEIPTVLDFSRGSSNGTNYVTNNYVINTCEWPNGSHVLFATAECASTSPWGRNVGTVSWGHNVSPYVIGTFDNLIERFSFSEPFFNPEAGQTQQVSAVFTANVDWTLEIQNDETNTVRTVTGSGGAMLYNWDGTGNGGTNLAPGLYTYLLTVSTNGQALSSSSGGGGGAVEGPPSTSSASSSGGMQSIELLLPPLPPGLSYGQDENGNEITSVWVEQPTFRSEASTSSLEQESLSSEAAFTSNYQSNSQSTRGPKRPPTNPVKGVAGKFGLAYQDFWPNGISLPAPLNGLLPNTRVQLEGSSGTINFAHLGNNSSMDNFVSQMKRGAWEPAFIKKNWDLKRIDLIKQSLGGSNIFSTGGVSFGVYDTHGTYGTSPDYTANQCQQMYFPIDQGTNASPTWIRMSELNFGSSGTNGLKWMAILACNSLKEAKWQSMQNAGITPFNSNLHLLMGTDVVVDDWGMGMLPKYLFGLDGNQKKTVMEAWYSSGSHVAKAGPIVFSVAGYEDNQSDMLTGTNTVAGSGDIFYDKRTVKQ